MKKTNSSPIHNGLELEKEIYPTYKDTTYLGVNSYHTNNLKKPVNINTEQELIIKIFSLILINSM